MEHSKTPASQNEAPAAEPTPADGPDRRRFLTGVVGAAGVAATSWLWFDGCRSQPRPGDVQATEADAGRKTFSAQEWRTLAAACERLLPSEGPASPGAADVNAIGYLDALLSGDDVSRDWAPIIKRGAATLDARAQRMANVEFAALPPDRQDAAIRQFESNPGGQAKPPGHKWLRLMLSGILEAFFCDPVHGGNTDEIAWKWAGHRPGFPRPTEKNWHPTERKA